jgi:hypothetical protein
LFGILNVFVMNGRTYRMSIVSVFEQWKLENRNWKLEIVNSKLKWLLLFVVACWCFCYMFLYMLLFVNVEICLWHNCCFHKSIVPHGPHHTWNKFQSKQIQNFKNVEKTNKYNHKNRQ